MILHTVLSFMLIQYTYRILYIRVKAVNEYRKSRLGIDTFVIMIKWSP
jgi:hypothetical protein